MSAGLYQCPSCGSTLRVPAGASVVRCPRCKTELDIGEPDPPPSAPVAPPLPFGPPAKSVGKPTSAKPPVKPAKTPPPTKPSGPVRAELVDEAAEEAEGRARAAARRRAAARDALLEQREEEEARAEEFESLTNTCKHGRTALTILTYALRGYAGAMMLAAAAVAALLLSPEAGSAGVIVALVLGQLATLALGLGFVFAILGPVQGRFLGIAGVVTILTQLVLLGVVLSKVLTPILGYQPGRITGYADALLAFHAIGLATYVPMLAETPARLIQGYEFSVLGVVVGAVEFTRLVLACQLAQVYADTGKEPELGHKSFASVSNFFWVVMLGAMFRMAAAFGFDWAPSGDLMHTIGSVAHAFVTVGILEIGGLIVLGQTFVMEKTVDVVTAERYILKGERLVE